MSMYATKITKSFDKERDKMQSQLAPDSGSLGSFKFRFLAKIDPLKVDVIEFYKQFRKF